MSEQPRRRVGSRFLSLVLRHRPEVLGLELGSEGWVSVDDLLRACAADGRALSREELEEIVATNSKQRFAFSEDGLSIRASQGHSVEVELGYEASVPPALLYHGTVAKVLPLILESGLLAMQRQHVHLSADEATAREVGARRGKAIVLHVDTEAMIASGHEFFVSANGVWLTRHVPAEYLRVDE